MEEKILSIKGLGLSLGIVSALNMLVMGIAGNMGFYLGAVEMMSQWHGFFNLGVIGILLGMIEAFIVGGIIGIIIAYFYNLVVRRFYNEK